MAVFTRTINTQDSRMIQKLSTVSGQVPTVAPSDNHVDGSWDSLDIYINEIFMNSADGKMWSRTSNGIKEIFIVPSTVANGDMFYLNASGGITRLPIGTSGQVLSVSSGNVPNWVDSSGSGTEPVEVIFKKSFNAADTLGGGTFDITELAAPGAGYAWQVTSAASKYTFVSIANDNLLVTIRSNSASSTKTQFDDQNVLVGVAQNSFITLPATAPTNSNSNIVENDKIVIDIAASATGNGTLIVYGTARKIAL
jgi:hypothetical protein